MQFRLQVVETHLTQMNFPNVRVVEADLLGLTGEDRQAAIAALSSGKDYPFVIVDGALACSGSLDIARIAETLERTRLA